MAVLKLFAGAREAAGESSIVIAAETVGELLDAAVKIYGKDLEKMIGISRIWLNGEQTDPSQALKDSDEVAILPPISGG
jgi:molybdopterin synthase sulfur carrier subunit